MTSGALLIDGAVPASTFAPRDLADGAASVRPIMREVGVSMSVLVADRPGPAHHPATPGMRWGDVLRIVDEHPDEFVGAIGVDPTLGSEAARRIRAAVADGAVAAHIVPGAFGIAPDEAPWYPSYATCADLGIPVLVELGIRPSVGRRSTSVGRPICLDAVACDLPELNVVGIGPWPWVEEAISVAYKHEGVYLAIGGDDPGGTDPSLIRFARSWGSGKVVFASGGSDLRGAVSRVAETGLGEQAIDALGKTARSLFLGQLTDRQAERASAKRND